MFPVWIRDTLSGKVDRVSACADLQNGTCIVAGGSEAQNEETQALAAQLIGCTYFNRTAMHVQASASQDMRVPVPDMCLRQSSL